jgi:L-serine dehydratase
MEGQIETVLVEFDPDGSLATTHESQGSDMGLFAGLLGWGPTDPRLVSAPQAIRDAGIQVAIEIAPIETDHPNTYKLTASNAVEKHSVTAVSTGGGIIEVIEIDGVTLSLNGDYYETLIFHQSNVKGLLAHLQGHVQADHIHCLGDGNVRLVQVKAQRFLDPEIIDELRARYVIGSVRFIAPVLPVLSRREITVPFTTCEQMTAYNRGKSLDLWALALDYECARGDLSKAQVLEMMEGIIHIMEDAIQTGLDGTEYADRILGYQSGNFQARMDDHALIDGGVLNQIILYTTALMESKSAMDLIVAAPTAGACGGLPGACIGAASVLGLSRERLIRAMLAGGLIGVFIAAHATFAAEVGGCQAECGAGSGMAAAALVTLAGGSTQQAVDAASMALQNILGMICDPVANRVEVPCLGKNVMAASNALACANMALAGYDPVIPLDEVIQTMNAVGKMLPSELRCTAKGGLSITPASKAIEARLAHKID